MAPETLYIINLCAKNATHWFKKRYIDLNLIHRWAIILLNLSVFIFPKIPSSNIFHGAFAPKLTWCRRVFSLKQGFGWRTLRIVIRLFSMPLRSYSDHSFDAVLIFGCTHSLLQTAKWTDMNDTRVYAAYPSDDIQTMFASLSLVGRDCAVKLVRTYSTLNYQVTTNRVVFLLLTHANLLNRRLTTRACMATDHSPSMVYSSATMCLRYLQSFAVFRSPDPLNISL